MMHVASAQYEDLFHAAISQSGVTLAPYPHTDKHPAYYTRFAMSSTFLKGVLKFNLNLRTLAEEVGCNPEASHEEIKNCLLKVLNSCLNNCTYSIHSNN